MAERALSTTALAKQLQMSSRRLFTLLRDYEWIHREEGAWRLLPKGEEQGGDYAFSESYGRYIVWPSKLAEHPLLLAAADATQITASAIAEHFGRPARLCNRVLRELGWIRRTRQGWLLTEAGRNLGAQQLQTENGQYYASWPRSLLGEPELVTRFTMLNVSELDSQEHEPDLFDPAPRLAHPGAGNSICSIDGHWLETPAEAEVCQWLYLLNLTHAYRHELSGHDEFICDFYLPAYGVYLDIWHSDDRPDVLARRLAKQAWCEEHEITLIELQEADISDLDNVLTEKLEELGIHVY